MDKKLLKKMLEKGFSHVEQIDANTYLFRQDTEYLERFYTYSNGTFVDKKRKFTKAFLNKVQDQTNDLLTYKQKCKKYESYGSTYKYDYEKEKLIQTLNNRITYDKLLSIMKKEVLEDEAKIVIKVPDLIVDLFLQLEKVDLHCHPEHKYFFQNGSRQVEVVYTKNVGIVSRLIADGKVLEQRRKLYSIQQMQMHLKLPVSQATETLSLARYVRELNIETFIKDVKKTTFKNKWFGDNVLLYALCVAQDQLLDEKLAAAFYKENHPILLTNSYAKIKRKRHEHIHMDDYQEAFLYLQKFMDQWNQIGQVREKNNEPQLTAKDIRMSEYRRYQDDPSAFGDSYDYTYTRGDEESFGNDDKEFNNPNEDFLSSSPSTPWTEFDDNDCD